MPNWTEEKVQTEATTKCERPASETSPRTVQVHPHQPRAAEHVVSTERTAGATPAGRRSLSKCALLQFTPVMTIHPQERTECSAPDRAAGLEPRVLVLTAV